MTHNLKRGNGKFGKLYFHVYKYIKGEGPFLRNITDKAREKNCVSTKKAKKIRDEQAIK